ncbi:hypothetical protein [Pseudomonas sp. P9(2020)]|uniref:hypothetical protein n=1 Tax=Pseudomonas sp. P9(2020) TaxID=2763316 RepID=UPI001B32D1A5|nr:hypothetical protein [Pseudomonas sp. P9(2020)]MBP5947890.1 hypothetical protein [Pseudomonas sp. P9(2020)]
MDFYQLVLGAVLIFGVQICLPIWIVGWRIKLPGDDVEARNRFRVQVIASFALGALLAVVVVWVLSGIFSNS